MANSLQLSSSPAESRKEVVIDSEKAWLIIRNGILTEIEWENGEIAWIVDEKVDFDLNGQKDSKRSNLFALCKDKLDELEEDGYRPVFSIEKQHAGELLSKGLEPHPTWIKTASVLAGTIGIPYLNKEANRVICILKPGVKLDSKKILPRLTGAGGLFRGVISTEKNINPGDLIMVDSETMELIGTEDQPESGEWPIDSGAISKITDKARSRINNQTNL